MIKAKARGENGQTNQKPKILRILAIIVLAVFAAITLTVIANIIINQSFTVSFYSVRCDKVSDNIRVAQEKGNAVTVIPCAEAMPRQTIPSMFSELPAAIPAAQ